MKFIISSYLVLSFFMVSQESHQSLVDVFEEPQCIQIKSTLNRAQCNNKTYIPIELPENSRGLIYSVRAVSKSDYNSPEKELFDEVKLLSRKYGASEISDYLVAKGTQKDFNFYIISGNENINSFNNCGHYDYKEKFINTKSRAGYLNITNNEESLYIGIENNKGLKNLRLIIEAVAIVGH